MAGAGWFIGQQYLLESLPNSTRLAIAGGLLGVGTIVAIIVAWVRAPSKLAAALLLDERCGLKDWFHNHSLCVDAVASIFVDRMGAVDVLADLVRSRPLVSAPN